MSTTQLEKQIPIADIITHRFDVTEANQALDTVEHGHAVKAVIRPAGRPPSPAQIR